MTLPPPLFIDSYKAFVHHLEDREYFGQKLGLERIRGLLHRLDDPQDLFSSIQIAGTNGKGSTAAMIESIFREAGIAAGLYTSPHLVDFCERVRIGSEEITSDEVMESVRCIGEMEEERLTFFELATAIAFRHFAERRVGWAVIETGLGGRLDATNVVHPSLSVITSIGFDHTQWLGNTLRQIAFEKGGIIKEGVPVVVGDLPEEAIGEVRRIAAQRNAPIFSPPPSMGGEIGLVGRHQQRNAAMAVTAVCYLKEAYQLPITDEAIRNGLAKVRWPGRLETIQEKPWVVLDGAHNPEAMAAVRLFLKERLRGRRLTVLFGAMADKDLKGILSEIAPITDRFLFTAPPMKRAAAPEELMAVAAGFGKPCTAIPQTEKAFQVALEGLPSNEVLLVTGSLFVIGELLRH